MSLVSVGWAGNLRKGKLEADIRVMGVPIRGGESPGTEGCAKVCKGGWTEERFGEPCVWEILLQERASGVFGADREECPSFNWT